MKIKFVQLESQAFLTDLDFVGFSAAERGVYCTLILQLYCSGGKCEFDPKALARLCNCENFEQIWERIAKKFQTRNGVIKHKRVTKELRRAKKFVQGQRKSGLRGAQKRWARYGDPNGDPMAKETKRNVIEKESKALTNTSSSALALSSSNSARPVVGLTKGKRPAPATGGEGVESIGPIMQRLGVTAGASRETSEPISGSAASQALHFNQALVQIIRPRSRSDRTCFRNVTNWLTRGCAEGRFTQEIFARVLDLAEEAKTGRKPAAVFMALLKKELGYKNG